MKHLIKENKNCTRVVQAHRAAFLIDGCRYFQTLRSAMLRARRSIMIVGWDIHSGVRLIRNRPSDGFPETLARLLDTIVKDHPELQIHILSWDFAMIYAMEREFFPRYRLKWRTGRQIHFRLDGEHPVGGSQHQKMVVIDDALAFAGGLDITKWRWDTSAHHPDDPRRRDPEGTAYPPFHDIQMMVEGSVAEVIGNIIKDRWKRVTGKPPQTGSHPAGKDLWPPEVIPDFTDVDMVVARTMPVCGQHREIREVEQLYLDTIAAARATIYIENQYLSASCIGTALEKRLREKKGPEVVMVLPEKTGGWLEQNTMDRLRGRLIRRLQGADQYGRLKIYYPRTSVHPPVNVMVHAKVMVIDDCFVRVGSSNLSNRSMGLDSELDLAIAPEKNPAACDAISLFRNRLLAEHLHVPLHDMCSAIKEKASLIKAIESLRTKDQTLVTLESGPPENMDQWIPDSEILDPEKPIDPEELMDFFADRNGRLSFFRNLHIPLILAGGLLLLTTAWHWTPLGDWVNLSAVMDMGTWIKEKPFSPLLVFAGFIAGGALSFPVTLMIVATVLIFGPWLGVLYALVGAQLSAFLLFMAGRWLGKETVQRFAGHQIKRLSRRISRHGILAVIILRVVPVAPFSVINLIAGISGIRTLDFVLGSLAGLLPGSIAIALVSDQILKALDQPDLTHMTLTLIVIVISGLGLYGLKQWLHRKSSLQSEAVTEKKGSSVTGRP